MTVVKPVLRRVHSPDVQSLEAFAPEKQNYFGILIQAMFGPEDGRGEESFDILVCSPEWIKEKVDKEKIVVGRHYLLVDRFNLHDICNYISTYADSCVGSNWREAAT